MIIIIDHFVTSSFENAVKRKLKQPKSREIRQSCFLVISLHTRSSEYRMPVKKPTTETQAGNLPNGLAAPARRALAQAGCTNLEQVSKLSEAELKELHGMGPKALEQLRQALAENGMAFAAGKNQAGRGA
jgi:hypothetical protein